MNQLYVGYWNEYDAAIASAETVAEAKKIIARHHQIHGENFLYLRVGLIRKGIRLWSETDFKEVVLETEKGIATEQPKGIVDWQTAVDEIKATHSFTWGY